MINNQKSVGGKNMYGAILGDMIGAPYEFDRGDKTKDFPTSSTNASMAFTVC